MSKSWTLSDAFAHFGAAGTNPRWSWSARSEDGKTVVMTLWQDIFNFKTRPISYDTYDHGTEVWTDTPRNRERLENLIWARDHCDGLFRVVVTVAEDVNVYPRKIEECFPQEKMVMRLVKLDEETGEFRAEVVEINEGDT